jgi:hypothetical protein
MLVAGSIYYDYLEFDDFTDTYYGNGLKLDMLFFVPPNESTWSHLQDLNDRFNDGFIFDPSIFQDLEIISSFYSLNDIAYFECYFQSYYEYTFHTYEQPTTLFVDNCFMIAFNKSNGVLCGYRSLGSAKGRLNGDKVTCNTELHLEQIGFDLPEFSHYTYSIDNGQIYVITTSSFIFIMVLVVRRKVK